LHSGAGVVVVGPNVVTMTGQMHGFGVVVLVGTPVVVVALQPSSSSCQASPSQIHLHWPVQAGAGVVVEVLTTAVVELAQGDSMRTASDCSPVTTGGCRILIGAALSNVETSTVLPIWTLARRWAVFDTLTSADVTPDTWAVSIFVAGVSRRRMPKQPRFCGMPAAK
jgi:hypothetical protein